MLNIDFINSNYLGTHSPGYVIDILRENNFYEYVIGNKSNYTNEKSLTSDTLYDIASLTKTFTATLVFMAYEDGLFDLNDFVFAIDSRFYNLKNVRILDLLCHRVEIWTEGYLGSAKTNAEFYSILFSSYVKSNTRKYIDVHYIILSTLLEKVYSKSYDKIVIEKIKNPLGLNSLSFDPDTINIASTNFEYKENGDVVNDIKLGEIHDTKARIAKKLGIFTGHASIFINGHDLLKFLKSFFDCSLLKKETIKIMLSHDDVNKINYNYLKSIVSENEINVMYKEFIKIKPFFSLPKTYNYMSCRYKNAIFAENDIPMSASPNSITFSGYTGPMFLIDFDRKIIIVVMCNVTNNNILFRKDRKDKTTEIVDKIYQQII